MPSASDLVVVDSFEVRDDGWVHITGKIPPGRVAELMKTGLDVWDIRPTHVDRPETETDRLVAGKVKPPPITDNWPST